MPRLATEATAEAVGVQSNAAPAGWDVFVWAACSQASLLIGCFSSPFFIVGAQGTWPGRSVPSRDAVA